MPNVIKSVLTVWGIWIGVGMVAAQDTAPLPPPEQLPHPKESFPPASSVGCCPAVAPAPPCKIIVHQAPPKVVFEEEPAPACTSKCRNWFHRRQPAATGAAAVSSVLTPLNLATTSFVSQSAGLNFLGAGTQLASQSSGFETELASLHAMRQMNAFAAQLKASRDARDAQIRAEQAYTQELQSHFSSVAAQMAGSARGSNGTQGAQLSALGGDAGNLNKRVLDLEKRMDALDKKLEDVSKKCKEIGDRLKP